MDAASLVAGALRGEQRDWDAIVEAYSGLLWGIARSYRMGDADAADAVQLTWLRLVEHLDRVNDHERLGAWLATTVRRECLQILRRADRRRVVGEFVGDLAADDPAPDERLLVAERDAALWSAMARLPGGCVRLLRLLMASPAPGYGEVAAQLDMPVGSIGPTRQRCLRKLRSLLDVDVTFGSGRTEELA